MDDNTRLLPKIDRLEDDNNIIVIVGSSGSGKTTLLRYITEFLKIPHLVTTTTREPRDKEEHGIDYYFVSKEEFEEKEDCDSFFEKTVYSGNKYGLEKEELQRNCNTISCVITDISGARAIADEYPERVMVFWIENKPIDMIVRLFKRGDSLKNILKRLKTAFKDKEFKNPYQEFVDVSYTTLKAEKEPIDNFGLVYYKLLTREVDKNNTYLNKLERK